MSKGHWDSYDATHGINGTVYAIQQDAQGFLWFATSHCGVTRYNGEFFTLFTTSNGLPHNTVRAILLDNAGDLWFGTERGVSRYSDSKFVDPDHEAALPEWEIRAIYQDNSACLWFGTWGNGVYKHDGKDVEQFTTGDELAGDEVNVILEDSSGCLWIGTTKGVSCYNGTHFANFLTGNNVTAILEDSRGVLWFGNSFGAHSYEGNSQEFAPVYELADRYISSILEDGEGYIWFGTYSGVSRYDGTKYQHFTTRDGLASNSITCISADREGNLWFGSHSCVVSRYDRNFEELTSLAVRDVMMEDRKGNLWFGVHDRGICRYDGKRFAIYAKEDGLQYTQVNSILQGGSGDLWIGSYMGLARYDGSKFRNFTRDEALGRYGIRTIAGDSKGNIWLGTDGGGACRYDGENAVHFTTADGMAHDVVWSIREDSQGNIWFGTLGGGVTRYDGRDFVTFTTEDGLANNIVRAILEDSRGHLWFATANGISKYDGQRFATVNTGLLASRIQCIYEDSRGHLWFGTLGGGAYRFDGFSFQILTEEDGIASNAIYSIIEDKTGRILFATQNGITRYTLSTENIPPAVYITKIVTDRIHTDCEEVEFPASVRHVSIEYQGMSFRTKRMAYIYKMEGVDKEWRFTWEKHCEYDGLPPGEYLFKVKAINRDMEYSREPAVVKLNVIPDPRDQLIAELQQEVTGLRRQLEHRYSFQNIVGESHQMQEVFTLVEKAIDSDLTVLVSGETGTGKELVARAIHYNSGRKDRPFVVQNCAAVPENLLESELFGHVKGAFTHAIRDKKGLFEVADSGTLFLDEIGDMSPELQARLLRVLEDGEIRRVGDTRSKRVDVRIIAATNRDLSAEISAGRFREDLYYRLAAYPITLPPLRERRGDIPALVAHFLTVYGQSSEAKMRFDPQAMLLLMDYSWPGNVRELENEVRRAVTLVDGDEIIAPAILSRKIKGALLELQDDNDRSISLKSAMERYEGHVLLAALRRNDGNVTRTAAELRISRVTLQKKMKKYGLREK